MENMEKVSTQENKKIKYCPNCCKQNDADAKNCECGYEFVQPEEKEEVITTSNTKVFVDNTPLGLWKFLGFITLGICAIIFAVKWKEKWPERVKVAKKGAINVWILIFVCIILYVIYLILAANGKIA